MNTVESMQQPLQKVAKIIMGQSPSGDTYNENGDGLPLLNGPTEFGPAHPSCTLYTIDSRRECERGDLIFCVRGSTTGRMNWADRKYSLGRGVCAIRGASQLETQYIHFCIKDRLNQLLKLAGGGTFPNLTKSDIENFPIPWLPTRFRIADILSAYDDLIEINLRRIKILEEMARSLYREWFVEFRFPGRESAMFVESPLGIIPEGWKVKKLGEVADTYRGRSYRSGDLADEGGVPFLNLKCLDRDGGFRRSGLKRYKGEFKVIHIAKKGDIIMAVTDMTQERRIVARAAIVPTLDNEFGIFSMDLVRIEPRSNFPKLFLYSFLRYSSFADEVKQHANGANVLHLSPDRITDFHFAVPPFELTIRLADLIAPFVEQVDAMENKIENLRRTRDLLIPRLLSGQLDVSTVKQ